MIIGSYKNLKKAGINVGDDVYACCVRLDGLTVVNDKPQLGRLDTMWSGTCFTPYQTETILAVDRAMKVERYEYATSLEDCQVLYNRLLDAITAQLETVLRGISSLRISCSPYTETELEKWWSDFKVYDEDVVVRVLNSHPKATPLMLRTVCMSSTWSQMSIDEKCTFYDILNKERISIVRQRAAVVPVIEGDI